MLTIHDFANATYQPGSPTASEIPPGTTWIDANAPTPEEIAFLKRALGVEPPTLQSMSEIETSSRLYRMHDAVCVTIPLPRREADGSAAAHPLALIITQKALLTVRYEHLKPCEPEHLEATGATRDPASPIGATLALLEGIVDHLADELELLMAQNRPMLAADLRQERESRRNARQSPEDADPRHRSATRIQFAGRGGGADAVARRALPGVGMVRVAAAGDPLRASTASAATCNR